MRFFVAKNSRHRYMISPRFWRGFRVSGNCGTGCAKKTLTFTPCKNLWRRPCEKKTTRVLSRARRPIGESSMRGKEQNSRRGQVLLKGCSRAKFSDVKELQKRLPATSERRSENIYLDSGVLLERGKKDSSLRSE